jgi:alkylation response protein AidB-like acyl-CoA dehydrogenase
MQIDCYAAESVVNLVAHMIDAQQQDFAVEASISKVFASEALWRTADEALQVAGGLGYMRELPYERVVRDARINRIFEGTNEVLRLFIALTAMSDVSSQLKELAASLRGVFADPIKGFGVLSDYARRQAQIRTGFAAEARFDKVAAYLPDLAPMFQDKTRQLAQAVDSVLRKHGRQIIGRQFVSRRLADIMIDLFVMAAVFSRVSTRLSQAPAAEVEKEVIIARAFAKQAQHRMEQNFARLDDNEDALVKALAEHAVAQEGYSWDVI